MSERRAVAPPWATDSNFVVHETPSDPVIKSTSRRFTSNLPLAAGTPGDFQTWTHGAHDSEASSWSLRNRPLPDVYGGLDKRTVEQDRNAQIDNPYLHRKKTPSLDANPYEGVLGKSHFSCTIVEQSLRFLLLGRSVDV